MPTGRLGRPRRFFAKHGPIDIVGHDWGALIAQRVAMLRPDLIRSWAASNAVIDPDYRGHRIARIWNTPVLGEIFMALSKPAALAKGLADQGLPPDIAAEEAAQWASKDKRRAILRLYERSLCRARRRRTLCCADRNAAYGHRRGRALGYRRAAGGSRGRARSLLEELVAKGFHHVIGAADHCDPINRLDRLEMIGERQGQRDRAPHGRWPSPPPAALHPVS
jgi:hypothetical protein